MTPEHNQKLERFAENKDFAIFDELRLLNDSIKDLIGAVQSSKSEVVSVSNLSDAIVDLSPLEDNFEALKGSVEAVRDAIKEIPGDNEMDMSGVEKLLKQIASKETDMSHITAITETLDQILYAVQTTATHSNDKAEEVIPDLVKIQKILKLLNENVASIEFPDFDYKELARIIKENVKITVAGGGGPGAVFIKDATSGNPIRPATEETLSQLVMSVENALSVAAYDLNAASYSGSTTITNDYLLDSIEFDFTTAISKTISVTTSTGAEIFTSTDSYQSIILTRNDLGQACNANDNITITVTQTAGACSMDLKVKIMKGSNTLVGNPTVKLQAYSPEESAYEEVRSVDNSMFVINYLDLVGIGRIDGHIPFRGFGQRQSLSTAVTGDDIWEGTATTIPIPPDAGDLMSLVSTSAQDGVAGTGVLSVDVHYIDPTGNPQSTVVTMNGTTAVNTGILMRFIQSIHTETVGSNGTAVGTVSIYKTGDVATVYNVIKPGGNVSLSSARMVPLGKTFYIKDTFLSGSSNKSISVRLRVTSTFEDVLNPRVFQYKEISFLQDSTKSSNKSVVIKAPALSIIKYTAYSTQTGGDISTSYEGWYE